MGMVFRHYQGSDDSILICSLGKDFITSTSWSPQNVYQRSGSGPRSAIWAALPYRVCTITYLYVFICKPVDACTLCEPIFYSCLQTSGEQARNPFWIYILTLIFTQQRDFCVHFHWLLTVIYQRTHTDGVISTSADLFFFFPAAKILQ